MDQTAVVMFAIAAPLALCGTVILLSTLVAIISLDRRRR